MPEQLDRIERKLNFLIIVASKPDWWRMFGDKYQGWNALSAFEDIIQNDPTYLKV